MAKEHDFEYECASIPGQCKNCGCWENQDRAKESCLVAKGEPRKDCRSYDNGNCSFIEERGESCCRKCSAYWPKGAE